MTISGTSTDVIIALHQVMRLPQVERKPPETRLKLMFEKKPSAKNEGKSSIGVPWKPNKKMQQAPPGGMEVTIIRIGVPKNCFKATHSSTVASTVRG